MNLEQIFIFVTPRALLTFAAVVAVLAVCWLTVMAINTIARWGGWEDQEDDDFEGGPKQYAPRDGLDVPRRARRTFRPPSLTSDEDPGGRP